MGKTKERAWRNTGELPRKKLSPPFTHKRALFMEKVFTWSKSNSHLFPETVNRVIQTHKWETFCRYPISACIPLVQEFYANYDPTKPDSVYVRGKLVDITPSNINSLFSLPNHYNTLFEAVLKFSAPVGNILKELTNPGTRWTRGSNRGLTFPRESLKAGPRIWVDFMQHKLVPCCNDKLIRKDHAVLLYCIMVGKPINVGKVIAKEIRDCASMNKGDLWFPALITLLCKRQNVFVSFRERVERHCSHIDVEIVEGKLDQEMSQLDHATSSLATHAQTDSDESWHDDDNDDGDGDEELLDVNENGDDNNDDGDDDDDDDDGDNDDDEELLDVNENGDDNDDGDDDDDGGGGEELLDVNENGDNNNDDGGGDDDDGDEELSDVNENDDDNNDDDGDEELLDVNENDDDDKQTSQSNHDTSSSQVPLIAAIIPPSRPPAEPVSSPQTDLDKLFHGDSDEELLDVKHEPHELGENVSHTSDCVAPPQNGIICIQGYKVKQNLSQILESIFKKHGDIASKCVFKTPSVRSSFLEIVCEVVKKIQTDDITNKMEDIERHVSEAEAANINVSWIRSHLETIYKENNVMKKSSLLTEMKANTVLVKNAARIDLRESCEELLLAQERFEKAERCVRVLHLVEKRINDNIWYVRRKKSR